MEESVCCNEPGTFPHVSRIPDLFIIGSGDHPSSFAADEDAGCSIGDPQTSPQINKRINPSGTDIGKLNCGCP
jgi:hypothetical protein